MDVDPFEGVDDILDNTNNLQDQFYQEGYTSGHTHGQLHGLFEGRALGREKAFELWEEVGYYEGWARFWIDILQNKQIKGKQVRALNHAQVLLELIATFPTTNPTPSTSTPAPPSTPTSTSTSTVDENRTDTGNGEGPDLPTLLSTIRARYRLLCSSLGVRPRLVTAASIPDTGAEGVEGPMKGVDTSQLKF